MSYLDLFSLNEQRALVTGSASGLGYEMARILAEAGAEVWVNGRNADSVNTAVTRIGPNARPAIFDVSRDQDRDAFLETMADLGGLDILINNVGMRDRRALGSFSDADIAQLLSVNLAAPFQLAQQAGLQMAKKGYGRIVNVSSIAGLIAQSNDALYTTSKSGLNGMTKALAAELGPLGVNVNAIAPGFFKNRPKCRRCERSTSDAEAEKRQCPGPLGRPPRTCHRSC